MKKWAFVLLLWPLAVLAEDTRPLSAEVLWELDRVGSPVISPAGNQVVAPVTEYDTSDDSSETRLYLFSPDGGVERPLTAKATRPAAPFFPQTVGGWRLSLAAMTMKPVRFMSCR